VQGDHQRHVGGDDQRERELADRSRGGGDVEQPVAGEGAEGDAHGQVGKAVGVEPHGGAAAGAPDQPERGHWRGDAGGDVAQARGQGEQRRQVAEGQVEKEEHPGHPERVRQHEAAGHARSR
jgi:hypothetical protein